MTPYDFVIIGGGCYGSYYVGQLREARERGKLEWSRVAVLDRAGDGCQVAAVEAPDVDVVCCEWTEFGERAFAEPELWMSGQLVPAPIAPHVVRHWLTAQLQAAGRTLSTKRWPAGPPEGLPYADVTPAGELVLSWAPGLCPTNCIEPRMCPLTQDVRTWDMPETAAEVARAAGLDHLEAFVCRHFAYGVGTIDFAMIRSARERVLAMGSGSLAIATVSGCHGLMGALDVRA